jgi:hypothetical protein
MSMALATRSPASTRPEKTRFATFCSSVDDQLELGDVDLGRELVCSPYAT